MKLYAKIEGKGKPFLILHGFLGMGDNWKTLGKQFSEWGFEVHLIDQRNHGRSPHSSEFNYKVLAEDLKDYCDDHGLRNVLLLGHSMGGKTAMEFAMRFPELVERLMVADIGPKYYAPHHGDILEGLLALDFSAIKSRNQADEVLAGYVPNPGIRMFLLKNLYWKEKGILALRVNIAILAEKSEQVGAALGATNVYKKEVLFLRGANSNYIQNGDIDEIKKIFLHSTFVTVPDAGHWLHAENSKFFANSIREFVNK